ncbi:MAG: ice-binding family protein [Acidimicrobiia bacterium]
MSSNRTFTSLWRAPIRHRRLLAGIVPLAVIALGAAVILPTSSSGAAQAAVDLGTATSFSVLAGAGITNTGATTISGDVGSYATPSETGFGTVTVNGTNEDGDAVTQQAKTDLTTAYNTAAGATPFTNVAVELGGTTLTPGVYRSPGTFGITGTLTLNTQGDPNAVFIFQTASTLISASDSNVVVLGGGSACNVFWQVGSSATLATGSHLIGSVLAVASITANTGATIEGRLLARNGAVTLDHNTITTPVCAAAATTTTAASGASTTSGATPTTSAATPTTAGSGATTSTVASGAAPVVTTTSTTTPALPGSTTTTVPTTLVPGTPGGPALPHTL